MGLYDYVQKSVRVAKDVAAAAKLIASAAPAIKGAMDDVEQAANLLRGDQRNGGDDITHGVNYPPNVLHAAGVLGLSLPTTKDAVQTAYRRAVHRSHPDNPGVGDNEAMVRVNAARKAMNAYLDGVSTHHG